MPAFAFPALFRELVARGQQLGPGRRWGALLVLGTMAAGLLELGLHFSFSRAAPRPEEWKALEPEMDPPLANTLVVVSPRWAEPLARQALGDAWFPLEHVARADESRFERAFEISILGEGAAELASWQLENERRFGRFQLRRWKNPTPARVLYDFVEHLQPPELSVWTENAGQRTDCAFGNAKVSNGDLHGHPTFPSPRFSCSTSNDALFVAATVIEDQRYLPRRCIWAHPPKRGSLRLRFEGVTLGNELRGYAGMPWFFERESKGTDVLLEIYVAGESVGRYVHADGEGWKPFSFSTARFAGQKQAVELSVQSAAMWQRWFCFQAEAR